MIDKRYVKNDIFGKRLTIFRDSIGINQIDIARAAKQRSLSVTRPYISMVESGQRDMNLQIILVLVLDFQINVLWLFTGLGEMQLSSTSLNKAIERKDLNTQLVENRRAINALNRSVALIRHRIKEESAGTTEIPELPAESELTPKTEDHEN